jgi:hypothetical protein
MAGVWPLAPLNICLPFTHAVVRPSHIDCSATGFPDAEWM